MSTKFGSKDAYIRNFSNKIRTASGRDQAEDEVKNDIARLKTLTQQVSHSVARRDAEIAGNHSLIKAITSNPSSYLVQSVIEIMKPKAAAEIREYKAQIVRLQARRGRVFGKELPLDKCVAYVNELMGAAQTVLARIQSNRAAHVYLLERKKEERAAEKAAHEKLLAPYRKRIELGHAALGKTRAVASVRKKVLSRKHPCPYCGRSLGPNPVADHIYPVARGGLSTHDNMIFVCASCNRKKRDFTLNEFIYRNNLDMPAIYARLAKQKKRF